MQSRFDHWDPQILHVTMATPKLIGQRRSLVSSLVFQHLHRPSSQMQKVKEQMGSFLSPAGQLSIIRQTKIWTYLCSALTTAHFCYRRMLSWALTTVLQYACPSGHSKAETMMGMHTSAIILPRHAFHQSLGYLAAALRAWQAPAAALP